MPLEPKNLQLLTDRLLEMVREYGILEVSMGQYEVVCRHIIKFAQQKGEYLYSPELMDDFKKHLDQRAEAGEICHEYRRFQNRVVRMISFLAETGNIDFSWKKPRTSKYPVPEEISTMIEDILNVQPVSDKTRSDLRGPIRHFFWYMLQHGASYRSIDDALVMDFLINEVPVTNSGSTGRTLRTVKYTTEYLKANGNTNIQHDYRLLTLKNSHRRIIPAFSEEEISGMCAAVDTESTIGKRDYAIMLLAYCTGLRGADIVLLKLSDIDWRNQRISVCQSKTHTPIITELNGHTMNALADYVLDARPACDVSEVFVTVKAPYRALSHLLGPMIDKYCEKASVSKIPMRAFHSLRRSFETIMVSRGVPIETASRMMGHKTVNEEKPYITHNKEKAAFVAMDFSDVPVRAGIYAAPASRHVSRRGGEGQ